MTRNIFVVMMFLALSGTASANYVGGETQYFNPTPENMDFFTINSSRTLPKGTMKTTLFFDYAENIHYAETLTNEVVQGQLGFALGLTDRMSFSVVGSGILNYNENVGGQYTGEGFTYVRTGLKYRFCECEKGGFAVVANLGFGLIDPDYFVGNNNDFGASVTLAFDRALTDSIRFGLNLGYRYRNSKGNTLSGGPAGYAVVSTIPRDGSDVLASLGLNFLLGSKWTMSTEVYSSWSADYFFKFDQYRDKGAEFLLGFNYSLSEKTDLGFGGVTGLMSNEQNADWRVFLGMGYAFGGEVEEAAFTYTGSSSAPVPVVVAEPKRAEPVKIEDAPVKQSFDITAKFVSGSANLTGPAKMQLDKVGKTLKASGDYRMIFVEGHTDSAGREASNKLLSQRRAQSVKNYLVRIYRVPLEKIQSVGFGETAPIADNSTPAGRAKNRRVVINVK